MDNLTLGKKLLGNNRTIEEKTDFEKTGNASVVYMIAVTSSSGGEVVLKDEVDESSEWDENEIVELDEDGDFEEYESEEDPLEDVDDSVLDVTDGDGVNIESSYGEESAVLTVANYTQAAQAAYATPTEEEPEATEDEPPDENAEIDASIDDGDAVELPDDGETSEEDELPDENAEILDLNDDDFSETDDDFDDEENELISGAEVSDGYTVAECIGSINAGDRVAVLVQNGKMTVIGVAGSGDQQVAETKEATQTAQEAQEAADNAQTAAQAAEEAASNAVAQAAEAKAKADQVELNLSGITKEVDSVKEDASKMRAELEETIETVRTSAEQTFAKKEDLTESETTLRSEITESVAGIQQTFEQDYAKKTYVDGAVIQANADLQTQITQNADSISMTAKSVEDIKVDVQEQNGKISEAQSAAAAAQTNANNAKNAAEQAQSLANEAKTNLETAQSKLAELEEDTSANQEEIEKAKQAVETAKSAAEQAQTAANTAQTAADQAQASAEEAKNDLEVLKNRVATAETKIIQNSEAIELRAIKTEVDEEFASTKERIVEESTAIIETAEGIMLQALSGYVQTTKGAYVTEITNYYLAAPTGDDIKASTDGWSEIIPTLSSGLALWNYAVLKYSDGNTMQTEASIVANYGSSNVTSIVSYYGANSNQERPTTETPSTNSSGETVYTEAEISWTTDIPELSSTTLYLWHFKRITFANGSTIDTEKNLIGSYQYAYKELQDLVTTQLSVLAGEISMKFTEAIEKAETVNNELQTQLNTITKYFTFNVDGLTIGQEENSNKVNIDNDEINILVNDEVVQTFNAKGQALIPILKVTKQVNLFGYLIEEDAFGNVNCEYIGENE